MEYRFLGKSGLQVSALSLGAWVTYGDQIGEEVALECMKIAYEAGINFFDNAEAYAGGDAEIIMGNVLKKVGWKRSDLVISTKIFWGGQGPNDIGLSWKHIVEGMNAALERLSLEYVDLVSDWCFSWANHWHKGGSGKRQHRERNCLGQFLSMIDATGLDSHDYCWRLI